MSNLSVGTRIRLTNDSIGSTGQLGTIQENDHSGVPYFIHMDDGHRSWACVEDVEALPTPAEFFRAHRHLRDRKIEMIKEYRSTFGVGLKEAKDAVEEHLARPVSPFNIFARLAAQNTVRKHWFICVLDSGNRPEPATSPRLYVSAEQASEVARIMAERNRGQKFVVYEATDVVEAAPPVVTPPAISVKL
jgi:hypothetical protein